MIKKICVFCSSSNKIDLIYFEAAQKIAHLMGEKNLSLIFGAGNNGLMGELAKITKTYECNITGVIPEALYKKYPSYRECNDFIITDTMHKRKAIMIEKADAFLTLPGGYGTLEELLEVITLKQLGYHAKPIVILNTNNFYSGLLDQFNTLYTENFTYEENLYFVIENEEDAINLILK